MTKIEQLKQQRQAVLDELKTIHKRADAETLELSADDQAKWDELSAKDERLKEAVSREERLREIDERQAEQEYQEKKKEKDTGEESRSSKYQKVFLRYMANGEGSLNPEERQILRSGWQSDKEERAQSTTVAAGGYTIPEGFLPELEKRMVAFGGLLGISRILRTNSGNALPFPTLDDTSNTGELVAENGAASEQDATFGNKTLNAYKFSSKYIKASYEIIEDSGMDFGAILMDLLGERLGRVFATYLATGTGSSQPEGVVTGASLGTTTAGASAVTRGEIIDLIHSVDQSYRGPNSRLAMNDSTLAAIKKLSIGTADDRPLWVPSMRDGAPSTIEGVPYVVVNELADLGTGNKFMLYGDFQKFIIRLVNGVRMRRLDELFALNDQFAFLGFARMDSLVSQTNAIKYAQNA